MIIQYFWIDHQRQRGYSVRILTNCKVVRFITYFLCGIFLFLFTQVRIYTFIRLHRWKARRKYSNNNSCCWTLKIFVLEIMKMTVSFYRRQYIPRSFSSRIMPYCCWIYPRTTSICLPPVWRHSDTYKDKIHKKNYGQRTKRPLHSV